LLEKAGFVEGGNYTHKQIEIALGKRIYATIVQTTDLVFEHTDKASIFIEDVSKKLTASLKEIFPEKQIIALSTSEQHEVRSDENPSKD